MTQLDEADLRSPSVDRLSSPIMSSALGLSFMDRPKDDFSVSVVSVGDKAEVEDEGFGSAGEDNDGVAPPPAPQPGRLAPPTRRFPPLSVQISHGSNSPRRSPSPSHIPTPPSSSPSPTPSPLADTKSMNPSDSKYAAFLQQWCFAHSTPKPGAMADVGISPMHSGFGMGTHPANSMGVEAVGMMG